MKCKSLVNAIGLIDGKFVDEAENYSPKPKIPVWFWTAWAACLCCAVFLAAWFIDGLPFGIGGKIDTAEIRGILGGKAEHGYTNYRELAQPGKVLITDELKSSINENYDKKSPNKYEFIVLIIDADGKKVPLDCLSSARLSGYDMEQFTANGTVSLTKKEIESIKAQPDLSLIVAPAVIGIDEEYLNTVDRVSLDVWVTPKIDYKQIKEQGEGMETDEYFDFLESSIFEFYTKYINDHGISEDMITDYRETGGDFHAELSTELISELLQDERTLAVWVPGVL